MDTPLISLIMPAYNCEATIGLAIETLAAQDYPVFELIVVDDGSSDSTPDIVEQLMARDSRIQLLRQEHASAGAARNTGMAHARGDYLLFVDADDAFEPTLLSTLYAASLVTGAEISMCNADCFLTTPAQVVRPWNAGAGELALGVYDTKHLRMRLFQCTTMVVWNKFFKADFIRGLGLQFQDQPRYNDAYFTIMALAHARTICKIEAALVHYRIGQGASLVDREIDEPYCDVQAFDAARTALEAEGMMKGPLRKSFDTLVVNTITWRLAHYARRSETATKALFNAYFGDYEKKWGLDNARWPHLRSARYALEYDLIKRVGVGGLLRAAAADKRDRTSKRSVTAEAAFITRLAREALLRKLL